MNETVIEEVQVFKEGVIDQLSNRDVISFRLGDLDFDGELNVGGNVIAKKCLSKILTSLRVRDSFFKYRNDISPEDWEELSKILKDANQNTEFWGKKLTAADGFTRITELYPRSEIIGGADILSNHFTQYFDYLIKALGDTKVPFELKSANFNTDIENVDMKLIATNSEIDLFQDGGDIWKAGTNVNWDILKVSTAPFFERLICSNGMTADQMGFKANIQNKKFNLAKIEKEISKLIVQAPERFEETIQYHSAHLKDVNLSLNEFYDFKHFFENKNSDERYDHILMKAFKEGEIYKNYAEDIKEKSKKWLGTANSFRNAYDFFNDMTYLASHTDEVNMDPEDARELTVKASTLFFKKDLDLEDVAPTINDIKVSKIFGD